MARLALTIAGGVIGGLLALPSGGLTVWAGAQIGGPTEGLPVLSADELLTKLEGTDARPSSEYR